MKLPFDLRQRGASTFSQIGCPQEAARVARAWDLPVWEAAGTEHERTADPTLPPIPAHEFDQRLSWAPRSPTRCHAAPGGLVPAPAQLPARGQPCRRAHPQASRPACGAARCRRKSTLDPPYRLRHTQPRALEMTIRPRLSSESAWRHARRPSDDHDSPCRRTIESPHGAPTLTKLKYGSGASA